MANKGKKTYYPGKRQQAVTINLTDGSHAAMDKAKEALAGVSQTDLLEHAWRRVAGLPVNEELDAALTAAVG